METTLKNISAPLLRWYEAERRHLPWREEVSPYRTWVSEIMLQQTRVAAVLPYFERFMAALPTVEALAAAEDGTLMKLWEGLGYYSRARHLKAAAQKICTEYGGVFPSDTEALLSLPGVGAYTAGAIASIAFGKAVPAVDGNVLRIVSRLCLSYDNILTDAAKQRVYNALLAVMPPDPGSFNQALMDLGALICLPKNPDCGRCPLRELCGARREGKTQELPVREKNKARKKDDLTVFVLIRDGSLALRQRSDTGLLAGLWEFPNTEGHLSEQEAAAYLRTLGLTVREWKQRLSARHLFTHREWNMIGYVVEVRGENSPLSFYNTNEFHALALPGAFRKFALAAEEHLQ